jgi:hypothetical protein
VDSSGSALVLESIGDANQDALPASHPFHVNESRYDTLGDLRQQVILEALKDR